MILLMLAGLPLRTRMRDKTERIKKFKTGTALMFINDLAKTYIKLEKIKDNLDKVAQKKKEILEQMNQKAYITDLVVRSPFEAFGEANAQPGKYKQTQEKRLKAYIASLLTFANEYHHALNCQADSDGFYQLKENRKNHITRLTTHEFFFYTKKPLSLEQFHAISQAIEKMAMKLTPNVHILLSSFAVQDNNGTLFNMSFFIEGGENPILHVFSKNTASDSDIDYNERQRLFSQRNQKLDALAENTDFHAEIIASQTDSAISNNSVFDVRTAGGACYTQAIDVCLDHEREHVKKLIIKRIQDNSDEFLPNQIEQCISSNTTYLYSESLISDRFLHVDPLISMSSYGLDNGIKILENAAVGRICQPQYPAMKIVEYAEGYKMLSPPFGDNCYIEVFKEKPAGTYKSDFQTAIDEHNSKALVQQLRTLKNLHLGKLEQEKIVQAFDQSPLFLERIEQLEKKMLKRCKQTALQELLNTAECKQKRQAKKIIVSSMKLIKDAIATSGNLSILLLRSWTNDLVSKINNIASHSMQLPLKNALKRDIKEMVNNQLEDDFGINLNI